MIQQKQHDWILNILENPDATIIDLNTAGLNADNTSLLDERIYISNEKIQNNPVFLDNLGKFDENKFHTFYENAIMSYNVFSNETALKKVEEEFKTYGIDNIFAPKRKLFDETVFYSKTPNPNQTTTGLIRIGEMGELKQSIDELAQSQKVLANPTEVYANGDPNWDIAIWHDSPNDSFFTDFFKTRVLATWDSNGTHTDPITGEILTHKKGEYILNENGTYFYENLDGRDIYGKQVLNKINILTTDGSSWNKYDFFDSDDKEQKSIGESVLKNAALVGSMFIPYVGPWIAGIGVANLLVGLTGTLGKMLTGSDSPTFSAMEGWTKSTSGLTASTEYAKQNTWCWENFINLIGSVVGQLKQQRFLFEVAPALFKGNKFLNAKGKIDKTKIDNLVKETSDDLFKQTKLKNLGNSIDDLGVVSIRQANTKSIANETVLQMLKDYYHVGEIIGKGYMTGIVVADTYGEAKLAGATDFEAAMLTMGYAAAELALLNTELGSWIMPELRHSEIRLNNMVKTFATQGNKHIAQAVGQKGKQEAVKHWFKLGEKLSKMDRTSFSKMGMVQQGALGEAFEEVSEELLADFSKACFNLTQWLQNDDTTRMKAFENVKDRYLMSLIGGGIGGGLTALGTTFNKDEFNYTPEQAAQEIIYKIRNNETDEIINAIKRVTLADPNLSVEQFKTLNGEELHKPANEIESLNDQLKRVAIQNIKMLDQIIKSEGLQLSDQTILDLHTLNDYRLAVLQNTPVNSLFLSRFNNLAKDIVSIRQEIHNLENSKKEDSDKLSKETEESIAKLNKQLKEKLEEYRNYMSKENSLNYISAALMSMSPMLTKDLVVNSLSDYIIKEKHNLNPSQQELEKYKKEYESYRANEYKNHIYQYAMEFLDLGKKLRPVIENFAGESNTVSFQNENFDGLSEKLKILFTLANKSDSFNKLDDENISDEEKQILVNEIIENSFKSGIFEFPNLINPSYKLVLQNALNDLLDYGNNKLKSYQNIVELSETIINDLQEEEGIEITNDISNEELLNLGFDENGISNLRKYFEIIDSGEINLIKNRINYLNESLNKLNSLPYTNITKFISDTTEIDLIKLLTQINNIINTNLNHPEIMQFGDVIDDINTVLNKIKLLKHLITAAKTDLSVININNPIGYNITLNSIAKKYGIKWEPLAEIDLNIGNIIELDIDLLTKQLEHAKRIYNINEHKKVTFLKTSAVKLNVLFFKKLNKFIVNINDSFKETELLNKALQESKILQELSESGKYNISEEKILQLEKEIVIIDNILFDLFKNNKDNLDKKLFSDFNFFNTEASTLDDEELSDRVFVSYLASRAALKKQQFINLFYDCINPEEGFVPISAQEEAIYQNIAMYVNNDMQNYVYNLFNQAMEDKFNSMSSEERKTLSKDGTIEITDLSETPFKIEFKNIQFTEGDAGTGKSTVVTIYTDRIIKLLNPLSNTWYIHTDKQKAQNSLKQIFNSKGEALEKDEFLETIFSKYKSNREINEKGLKIYESDEIIDDELSGELLNVNNVPDVIYIDEISYFDLFELEIIDKFALKHGIKIYVSGDFEQSGTESIHEVDKVIYNYASKRTIFKTGIKLNLSMRTNNSQLDKSINEFKVWRKELEGPINIYHYENDEEINGIKRVQNIEQLKESLEIMLKNPNISEDNPITFIYYTNSPASDFIKNHPLYGTKIVGKSVTAAQGLEGDYYIVDFSSFRDNNGNELTTKEQIIKNYYTAITRATKGCVIFKPTDGIFEIISHQESITQLISSPKKTYQSYSQDKKKLLEQLKNSEVTKKEESEKENDKQKTTSDKLKVIHNKIVYFVDKNKIVYNENGTEVTNDEIIKEVLDKASVIYVDIFKNPNEGVKIKPETPSTNIKNNGNQLTQFTQLFHSHNTFELGVIDDNGKIKHYGNKPVMHSERIDSVHGLMKLYNGKEGDNITDYITMIKNIREVLFEHSTIESITNSLRKVLNSKINGQSIGNINEIKIEYGVIGTKFAPKNRFNEQTPSIFTRYGNEEVIYNEDGGSKLSKNKKVSAIITINLNGVEKKLIIPLFVLANLGTYGNNKSANDLAKKIHNLKKIHNDISGNDFAKDVLNDPILSQIPQFKSWAQLYLKNDNFYIKFDDSWIPRSNLKNYGILVKTKTNAMNQFVIDLSTTPIPIAKYAKRYYITNKIYASSLELDQVHRGHGFILISQSEKYINNNTRDDLMIEDYFVRGNPNKDITLVYVTPPQVSIEEYLKTLYGIFNKEEFRFRIGNIASSYQILKLLQSKLGKEEFSNLFGSIYQDYIDKLYEILKNIKNSDGENLTTIDFLLEKDSKGKRWYLKFNEILFNLYISPQGHIIEDKLNYIVSKIGEDIKLYYGFAYESESGSRGISAVDAPNYQINGKDCVIHAKLDSNLFAGDMDCLKGQLYDDNGNLKEGTSIYNQRIFKINEKYPDDLKKQIQDYLINFNKDELTVEEENRIVEEYILNLNKTNNNQLAGINKTGNIIIKTLEEDISIDKVFKNGDSVVIDKDDKTIKISFNNSKFSIEVSPKVIESNNIESINLDEIQLLLEQIEDPDIKNSLIKSFDRAKTRGFKLFKQQLRNKGLNEIYEIVKNYPDELTNNSCKTNK